MSGWECAGWLEVVRKWFGSGCEVMTVSPPHGPCPEVHTRAEMERASQKDGGKGLESHRVISQDKWVPQIMKNTRPGVVD